MGEQADVYVSDDEDDQILNRLKSVDHNENYIEGESSPGAPTNNFEHQNTNMIPSLQGIGSGGDRHNPTSTATQLDNLDRDEVLKMINQ